MISLSLAEQLVDFHRSKNISVEAAREQLRGAVAIHNILEREKVAYLADEVGMGKTYVALGAMALFRHFNPSFRVLVIAPRENIQKKWVKELKNFVTHNYLITDLRVKAAHGAPARGFAVCRNLLDLVREATLNPHRDFFARMSSFSLGLGADTESWKAKRDELLKCLPWLGRDNFDLRDRSGFKENFARAVCCSLPVFDLVIIDEGHNLKHGFGKGVASRNRVLGFALGHPEGEGQDGFRGYAPRAKRVLFLSATPLENDYKQLWNQLHLVGFGGVAPELKDKDLSPEQKKAATKRFLIRRVTSIEVSGVKLTKNLYRREWHNGGVEKHDAPLQIPGDKQRLIVALVQKKVGEVLGSEKFNNSFQIGMLASFESFLETARVRPRDSEEEESIFDDPDQTESIDEKLGADVGSINQLARNYRKRFEEELPHPKMDAIVASLAPAFETGCKSLVFVRRIASVKELQRKLEQVYNDRIFARLLAEIDSKHREWMERVIARYLREKQEERQRRLLESPAPEGFETEETEGLMSGVQDEGGLETFFAWFFRGEGPSGLLSGAKLQLRFSQAGARLSTVFEDNHVGWLLGARPGQVFARLSETLGMSTESLKRELQMRADSFLPSVQKQQRRNLFAAFQQAALSLLADKNDDLGKNARIVLNQAYPGGPGSRTSKIQMPDPKDWLELVTFWTELRQRPELRQSLWPRPEAADFRDAFRERELRRELFSGMARLGNPFIDLFLVTVNRMDKVELNAREAEDQDVVLIRAFLDLLQRQAQEGDARFTAYSELAAAAKHFHLLLDVNLPDTRDVPLPQAVRMIGTLLGKQQPIGGMFGEINQTLVRQFRMPGYPLVLITTDLLQEGEDLHTFCSSVHHYGISWMPSSMEQRIGRIDRVSSLTERRLTALGRQPSGDDKLQVYYPHLKETVEVLQVDRVLHRMQLFLKLMHEDLGVPEGERRSLDVSEEILRVLKGVERIAEPLKTAFPVDEQLLSCDSGRVHPITCTTGSELLERFASLRSKALEKLKIEWQESPTKNTLVGVVKHGSRSQSFELRLRSFEGHLTVRCISPIGKIPRDESAADKLTDLVKKRPVQLSAVDDPKIEDYNLTVEGDVVLGHPQHDSARVAHLIHRITTNADEIERDFLGVDQPHTNFAASMNQEAYGDS
jgi:hypothetical protein